MPVRQLPALPSPVRPGAHVHGGRAAVCARRAGSARGATDTKLTARIIFVVYITHALGGAAMGPGPLLDDRVPFRLPFQ